MNEQDFDAHFRSEGLLTWPDLDAMHAAAIADAAVFLSTAPRSIRVDHPRVRGLRMDLDPAVGAKIFHLLRSGQYEPGDFELYERHLAQGDRVLELGGGVGITAAFCAQCTGMPVTVVEPNPGLHELIRRQARVNAVDVRIDPRCVVAAAGTSTVDFHLHDELWRSSISPEADFPRGPRPRTIRVDAVDLQSLLDLERPDALIIDIEGEEAGLCTAPLRHLPRKLFIEIHVPRIGAKASAALAVRIERLGLRFVESRDWMFHFAAVQ